MQVNAGPVSQDGQGQNPSLNPMMGRSFDNKNMAIDCQLLQSAHQDDPAQALAAAAQQRNDPRTEYAIQQLQGYNGIKEDRGAGATHHQLHGVHGQMQHGAQHGLQHGMTHTLPHNMGHSDHAGGAGSVPMAQAGAQFGGAQMNPPSMTNGPGSLASMTSTMNKPAVGSEEYYRIKKYNHKEVERRRRETINKGIDELGKVVPECDKHKGQILAHAVEYIKMLKDKEETLLKQLTLEKLISEQSINELTSENKSLKAELAQTWKELDHYKRQSERTE